MRSDDGTRTESSTHRVLPREGGTRNCWRTGNKIPWLAFPSIYPGLSPDAHPLVLVDTATAAPLQPVALPQAIRPLRLQWKFRLARVRPVTASTFACRVQCVCSSWTPANRMWTTHFVADLSHPPAPRAFRTINGHIYRRLSITHEWNCVGTQPEYPSRTINSRSLSTVLKVDGGGGWWLWLST